MRSDKLQRKEAFRDGNVERHRQNRQTSVSERALKIQAARDRALGEEIEDGKMKFSPLARDPPTQPVFTEKPPVGGSFEPPPRNAPAPAKKPDEIRERKTKSKKFFDDLLRGRFPIDPFGGENEIGCGADEDDLGRGPAQRSGYVDLAPARKFEEEREPGFCRRAVERGFP